MKKLPISIQTFEDIVSGGMAYVDKTAFIWELAQRGKFYFLSRPRRFGKSLLLTTLKSFFEGRRDLFEGLYISGKEASWKKHPILHLDYSLVEYKKSRDVFEQSLLEQLYSIASGYRVKLESTIIANAFTDLVKGLYEKNGPVVVLVDEYDKAMVDMLDDEKRFEENREVLRGLYGAMKGLDQYFRFVMLTGVSRFAKVNVFSGLNNLQDISMSAHFSQIVGFSQEELEENFGPHLEAVRQKFGVERGLMMEAVRKKYNGFSWDAAHRLYNPFSLFRFLIDKEFGNYWFSTGTPTFLIGLIKRQKQLPEALEGIQATDLEGNTAQINNLPVAPILFQTGYLSIEKIEYEGFDRRFYLNYPNEEVRDSFIRHILAGFVGKDEYELQPEALGLRDALREERTDDFIALLQSFLADIPARLHIPKEAYYHSLAYMVLRLTGVHLLLEKETSKGRIDAVLEFPDKVYIIEIKFARGSRIKNVKTLSRQAIAQIEKNRYHEPYLASGKKVLLFGIGFLDKQLDGRVKAVT
ncbi:MAG: AAA family ATPase [Phaeodactylibacter sp.]|nr:AAA family ATPase [Phaeodactylibacter sp.]